MKTMSYKVLARKYRPQTLDQIIGQEHISRTLKNAIEENRVAHAYLFSGPRGVGKTTTARFLAKALNCKQGPTAEPCGECVNCQEIAAGTGIDVQEIDGASNRGIDEIRALRENVKFAPASSKYKIYIVDEAHQITDAAFNALLKTLEEPPEHVVFILATTEPQKIPVTILSRCQRYRFRLISAKEVTATLEKIAIAEGFDIEPAALAMITASSGGSLRDALSMLDQAVSYVSGKVTHKDIHDLLGFLPREIVMEFSEALAAPEAAKILAIIKDVFEQGYNLLQFGRDLRNHLRQLLLFQVNPSILEITPDEKKLLEKQNGLFSTAWLIRSGHLISRALDEMRWSDQPRLIFELAMMKLAQPYVALDELVERLEKMEKGIPFDSSVSVDSPASKDAIETAPIKASANTSSHYFSAASDDNSMVDSSPSPKISPVVREELSQAAKPLKENNIGGVWKEVVAEMRRVHPIIAGVLDEVRVSAVEGNNLLITASNKFQQEGIKRNQSSIEEILEKKTGQSLCLKIAIGAPSAVKEEKEVIVVEEEETPPPPAEMFQVEGSIEELKNAIPPGLEKIVDKFPGRITKKKKETN